MTERDRSELEPPQGLRIADKIDWTRYAMADWDTPLEDLPRLRALQRTYRNRLRRAKKNQAQSNSS